MRLRSLLLVTTVAAALVPAAAPAQPSPAAQARVVRTMWLREIAHRAKEDRRPWFRNLSHPLWFARLHALERRYGFQVVEVKMLRPVQDAPMLVVRTTRKPAAFAHDVRAIQRALDPKRPTNDDRTGWRYEGFYFEARDAHGVPFLAVFNFWRGAHKGGGQWARDPSLYPYPVLDSPYRG